MSRRHAAWLDEAIPARRLGLKGPRAAEALAQLGLAVPDRPNSWAPLTMADKDSWNLVGRLGSSEYFIEESADAPGITALEARLAQGVPGAYPVLREDCALVLGGSDADEVLAETCNVNFAGLHASRTLVMTLMIGVAVLVVPQHPDEGEPVYRIWCDPGYGSYLQSELEEIVTRITTGSAQ